MIENESLVKKYMEDELTSLIYMILIYLPSL